MLLQVDNGGAESGDGDSGQARVVWKALGGSIYQALNNRNSQAPTLSTQSHNNSYWRLPSSHSVQKGTAGTAATAGTAGAAATGAARDHVVGTSDH